MLYWQALESSRLRSRIPTGHPTEKDYRKIMTVLLAIIVLIGVVFVLYELYEVLLPLVLSPVIGFIIALAVMRILLRMFASRPPARVGPLFRRAQIVSAAFMAFSHGSNDAQKTMGIITLALVSAGLLPAFHVPMWVIVLSAVAMATGTFAGGRRIIHTMGTRLAHLEPIHGFAAETAAAAVIQVASRSGFPLSTTNSLVHRNVRRALPHTQD